MTPNKILESAKWNKDTAYTDELTFIGADGFKVSVVRSVEGMTRKDAEEALIERVQARYE